MRHEDWTRYQLQAEEERSRRFGEAPRTLESKVKELRAEVDGLSGRIKQELLAELKVEIERLIEKAISY